MAIKRSHKPITEKDLLTNHRELIRSYMKTHTQWKSRQRRQVLKIYDARIDTTNIKFFLSRSPKLFLSALVYDKLNQITNYIPKGYELEPAEA